MAVKVMFGFETGMPEIYGTWTGGMPPFYVEAPPNKNLPPWDGAEARTGDYSAKLRLQDDAIEFDPLSPLPGRSWYTFGIRFLNTTLASDLLFLEIRNNQFQSVVLQVYLTPSRTIKVRSPLGGQIVSSASLGSATWYLVTIEIRFALPFSEVKLYIDSDNVDVESAQFSLNDQPREARFFYGGKIFWIDDIFINDDQGDCNRSKPVVPLDFGIYPLRPTSPDTEVVNFTDLGGGVTNLYSQIDEHPWPPHSSVQPCDAAVDAAVSVDLQNESRLRVTLPNVNLNIRWNVMAVSALCWSKEQHINTPFWFGVWLNGAKKLAQVNNTPTCWIASVYMMDMDPNNCPWTSDTLQNLELMFKAEPGPEGDKFTIEGGMVEYAHGCSESEQNYFYAGALRPRKEINYRVRGLMT